MCLSSSTEAEGWAGLAALSSSSESLNAPGGFFTLPLSYARAHRQHKRTRWSLTLAMCTSHSIPSLLGRVGSTLQLLVLDESLLNNINNQLMRSYCLLIRVESTRASHFLMVGNPAQCRGLPSSSLINHASVRAQLAHHTTWRLTTAVC